VAFDLVMGYQNKVPGERPAVPMPPPGREQAELRTGVRR
jgi:hypothetical protein